MNECQTVRDLLALRPGDRSADERRRVENHLVICSDCAALARTYAEQDRLIQATPRVRLTPSQRGQLLSHTQRGRRRHEMRTKLSTILGTVTAVAALIALTLGLYVLFGESDQLTGDAPSPTDEPSITPEPPILADEIHIDGSILDPLIGKPITLTLDERGTADLSAPGKFYVPANVHLTLNWQVLAPLSADWRVFVHLMSEAGELVLQSDLDVDWPAQPCPAGEYGPQCTVTTEHEWAFPADLPPGLYTIVTGLYDPETGERAPVTNPAGATPPQIALGRVEVIEPLVFAGQIRIDGYTRDPQTEELVPFTLGERDPADLSAPGRLQVPADVPFTLNWQVLAPPSADWRVFVHLMSETGELVLQSDVDVDWPAQPCPAGEYGPQCTVTTEHEWAFPADLPPGLYTIVVGLYDPETGERAPVTSPAGATPPQVALGRVQVVADK